MYLYSVAIGESGVDSPKAAVAKIHKVFFLLKVDLAIKEVMPLVLNVVMSQDFFFRVFKSNLYKLSIVGQRFNFKVESGREFKKSGLIFSDGIAFLNPEPYT